jgi:hypothetical protein
MEALNFGGIRAWRGSQDQAFEELCFQLRDETPAGAELFKIGAPDGGVEWYVRHRNGVEWGWQVKYSTQIDSLLKSMEESLKTVVKVRPACRRLTFCIPFDLPDSPDPGKRKSARQKFEDRKKRWIKRIPGAHRVRIELTQEGDLLDRLNGHRNQRGITWFFWNQEVFSPEWCARRLEVTVKAAGDRYTPELHLDLPVAFALEGLGATPVFWDRYRALVARVEKLASRVAPSRHLALGVTAELRAVARAVEEWRPVAGRIPGPPDRLRREDVLGPVRALTDAVGRAHPPRDEKEETEGDRAATPRRSTLRHDLRILEDALADLEAFLDSPAATAAELGGLLMTGDAGQGKTHLFCDSGRRAIEAGRPAAVLLGNQFSGRDAWGDIAKRLGLGDVGSEVLVGGMQSAAEAAGEPFLLFIDALNESADARGWQEEIPALLAEIDGNPWISFALSVRSPFLPVVLPPGDLEGVAEIEHPGFRGHELEATERFFDHFGLAQPQFPLLTPEFSNPLFLKLYCEGLRGLGQEAPPAGGGHITEVFSRYLKWKETRIVARLKLDPALHPVSRAVRKFSEAMVAAGREQIPYDDASQMVAEFAPAMTEWPDTLFGQLLSEGILTKDIAWDWQSDDYREVVRFTYQRFADHSAVGVLLAPFPSAAEFERSVSAKEPLRRFVYDAPAGWIEALSVQLPERFGVELLDAANWRHPRPRTHMWDRALLASIVARVPGTVTDRSRDLLRRAQRRTPHLSEEVLEALLSIAPQPLHPMNARYLHSRLMEFSMQRRDLIWSMPTYFAFRDEGPLDRLIRWSARGSHAQASDDVVILATLTVAWTFTSPNRRMRDFSTKALVHLLSKRLNLVPELLSEFRGVNDPYVAERLMVVAHGAILIGGRADQASALAIAQESSKLLLSTDGDMPSVISRDAVRGIWEWCLRANLVSEDEYEMVTPPYGSAPPAKPRTRKQLERRYERGNYEDDNYNSIFFSLFGLGDFGRYVVGSKVRNFSKYPLARPIPKRRAIKPEMLAERRMGEFEALLGPSQLKALVDAEFGKDAIEALEPAQRQAFHGAMNPREPPDPKAEFQEEWANRWIFERVLEMGWEPGLFDRWERTYVREGAGRDGHKPERFGKKYQWIALRDLLARLSDNFHMAREFRDARPIYEGPWQFHGRDIDPTLPPAPQPSDGSERASFGATFARDPVDIWWTPPGPSFRADDPLVPDDWASQTEDVPSFSSLVERLGPSEHRWVVLQAYFNWDEERDSEGDIRSPRRRDMWSHIKSWLVPRDHRKALVNFLGSRSLINHWMPEGLELTDAAYLAEMPWARSTQEYPDDWRQVEPRMEAPPVGLLVYPTWSRYVWEGVVWDCSIDDTVLGAIPSRKLFEGGELEWRPGRQRWLDPSGKAVAEYNESAGERHSALLVREDWLSDQLQAGGWALVVGWLGEKQLFANGFHPELLGSWTEINGTASFDGKKWSYGKPRFEFHEPPVR